MSPGCRDCSNFGEPFVVPAQSCGCVTAFPRVLTAWSRKYQGSHAEGWRRTQTLLPEAAGLMKMGGMEQSLLITVKFGWDEDKKQWRSQETNGSLDGKTSAGSNSLRKMFFYKVPHPSFIPLRAAPLLSPIPTSQEWEIWCDAHR